MQWDALSTFLEVLIRGGQGGFAFGGQRSGGMLRNCFLLKLNKVGHNTHENTYVQKVFRKLNRLKPLLIQ